jgi:hypothetical protein
VDWAMRRAASRASRSSLELQDEDPGQQKQQRKGDDGDETAEPSANGPTAARHAWP